MTKRPKQEQRSVPRDDQKRTAKASMILPYNVQFTDVRTLADYLTKKPLGATHDEIRAALGSEILDWRKLEGYRFLGFFEVSERFIKLGKFGVTFMQADEPERRRILRKMLRGTRPYNGILEWAYFKKLAELSVQDVLLKWSTEFPEVDSSNAQRFKSGPVFFFSFCEAAGIGNLVVGRKGQPTRLVIERSQLEDYISAAVPVEADGGVVKADVEAEEAFQPEVPSAAPPVAPALKPKIFISHGRNKAPLKDLEEMLKIMKLDYLVAIEEPNLARPVSQKVRDAMKQCTAAIFVFTPDQPFTDEAGKQVFRPSENVLHELGAASVLYDDRVILYKEQSIQLPSNISGLAHIPFSLENIKSTFMDLYKELKGFNIV